MTGDAADPDDIEGAPPSAIRALLKDDRPLHRHPCPIPLIDRDKNVVAANVGGRDITHGLITATASPVAALIDVALADTSGPPRIGVG